MFSPLIWNIIERQYLYMVIQRGGRRNYFLERNRNCFLNKGQIWLSFLGWAINTYVTLLPVKKAVLCLGPCRHFSLLPPSYLADFQESEVNKWGRLPIFFLLSTNPLIIISSHSASYIYKMFDKVSCLATSIRNNNMLLRIEFDLWSVLELNVTSNLALWCLSKC